jgi:transposase
VLPRDLDVHQNVVRKWVREFASDPVQAFPGHGQIKPKQLEIERLRREVVKLQAERDLLKKGRSLKARGPECAPRSPAATSGWSLAFFSRSGPVC